VVAEVAEVAGLEQGGGIRLVPLFSRREGGELLPTGHLPSFAAELWASGLIEDPIDLVRGQAAERG
jgi:hypothetical protein